MEAYSPVVIAQDSDGMARRDAILFRRKQPPNRGRNAEEVESFPRDKSAIDFLDRRAGIRALGFHANWRAEETQARRGFTGCGKLQILRITERLSLLARGDSRVLNIGPGEPEQFVRFRDR